MKKIYSILVFSFLISFSYAQSIYFEFTNGTQQEFALSTVQNITFSGNDMFLNLKNGTNQSWNVFEIANYNYKGYVGINEQNNFSALKLFPNPVQNHFQISFENKAAQEVKLEIINLNGEVMNVNHYTTNTGNSSLDISSQIKDLAQGVYFCRISTEGSSQTEKIIKN